MRRKAMWVNEYQRCDGSRLLGPAWADSQRAAKFAHPFLRLVGRWKITLKEAPRDGR